LKWSVAETQACAWCDLHDGRGLAGRRRGSCLSGLTCGHVLHQLMRLNCRCSSGWIGPRAHRCGRLGCRNRGRRWPLGSLDCVLKLPFLGTESLLFMIKTDHVERKLVAHGVCHGLFWVKLSPEVVAYGRQKIFFRDVRIATACGRRYMTLQRGNRARAAPFLRVGRASRRVLGQGTRGCVGLRRCDGSIRSRVGDIWYRSWAWNHL